MEVIDNPEILAAQIKALLNDPFVNHEVSEHYFADVFQVALIFSKCVLLPMSGHLYYCRYRHG